MSEKWRRAEALFHRAGVRQSNDVEFRISGKHVFVKTPDGKEIKARLCDRVGMAYRAATLRFLLHFPQDRSPNPWIRRRTIRVSAPYATDIRAGRRPHPRHWLALAQPVGVSPDPPAKLRHILHAHLRRGSYYQFHIRPGQKLYAKPGTSPAEIAKIRYMFAGVLENVPETNDPKMFLKQGIRHLSLEAGHVLDVFPISEVHENMHFPIEIAFGEPEIVKKPVVEMLQQVAGLIYNIFFMTFDGLGLLD